MERLSGLVLTLDMMKQYLWFYRGTIGEISFEGGYIFMKFATTSESMLMFIEIDKLM
jgi:hypothetical protein